VESYVSPTARALQVLELVQATPGITADRLAYRVGVSARAIRRQVAILREAGMPIESSTGPYGGYRVGRGVRVPPLVFSTTEALGLVMAVLDGHHNAADAADPVGSALAKIIRALPAAVAAPAETVLKVSAAAPDRAAARPEQGITTDVVHACANQRRVRLQYRMESGTVRSMDVDPWAVVVRHGRWYLLAWSHTANARRVLRVDRVISIDRLSEPFTPPADLNPVAAVEEQLSSGWRYATDVVFEAPVEWVERHLPRVLGRPEALDANTTRVAGSTSNHGWYIEELARLDRPFRVLGSPEFRHAVRTAGEHLLAAVSDGPSRGASGGSSGVAPHSGGQGVKPGPTATVIGATAP